MKIDSLGLRAKRLKSEIHALYLAARDPRTPWYAKILAISIIGYALSPIDLIPDFIIPILGYLDDLIIVPAGIALLLKIILNGVLQECREKAHSQPMGLRRSWVAGTIIGLVWLLLIHIALRLLWGIVSAMNEVK
jgi:uncharacterized membrane protein YkvA (DUF1232 family)